MRINGMKYWYNSRKTSLISTWLTIDFLYLKMESMQRLKHWR